VLDLLLSCCFLLPRRVQFSTYDDAHPFAELCPKLDYKGAGGADEPTVRFVSGALLQHS
jgi:hypothetical protein